MKMYAVVVLTLVVSASLVTSTEICKTNKGGKLIQFNNATQDMLFPCKYWALRQQKCGKYKINLSPGHRWLYPKYFLDTLWLGVLDTNNNTNWAGRTTNKKAAKFYNSNSTTVRELFTKKDGNMTADVFEYGRISGVGVYIQDKDKTFRVTFTPWDPTNKAFKCSNWEFECFDSSVVLNEYPAQMCGGSAKQAVRKLTVDKFNLNERFRANVILFHLFQSDVVHTNPKCDSARSMLQHNCTDDHHRMLVINNCKMILNNPHHTKCFTRYNCDPMDVFNDCVAWGCIGNSFSPNAKVECAALAEDIDFCPEMKGSGNITARVEDANCYNDFVTIRTDLN